MSESQVSPTTPVIKVSRVDFADVPLVGSGSTLARLTSGDLAGYAPLLDLAGSEFGVDSRYLDRAQLADVLEKYNRSVGNELSVETLDAIRGAARLVIAGQQPGLLTGPMLCPLKAITAICLAKKLNAQSERAGGAPILPAFWIASEDHDLAEVNRVMVGDRKLVLNHDELSTSGANPPVGRVSLEVYRDEIITFAREQLSDGDFGAEILDALERAPYDNYADFFAYLTAWMFKGHGLILIDPMCLRHLAAEVMSDIASHYADLEKAFDRGAARLGAVGLNAPLDKINLFHFENGGRTAVPVAALDAAHIRQYPESYSPGAALRPIMQDAVLPVVATVAGPTELIYLWQIDRMYDVLDLQRSKLHPRMGATILDEATIQAAANVGLKDAAVFEILDLIDNSNRASLSTELMRINKEGDSLLMLIDEVVGGLEDKVVSKGRASLEHQLGKITQRLSQLQREEEGRGPRALKRVAQGVYPGKQLQERTISILPFLAQAGVGGEDGSGGLIHAMIKKMDVATPGHWLIQIRRPQAQGSGKS